MRYFACAVVFFYFCMNTLYGQQNLVLNPSFEDVNEAALSCDLHLFPQEFENAINQWKCPSLTPDIYHLSLPNNCQSNPLFSRMTGGYQLPRTGSSMVGFFGYVDPLIGNGGRFPMELIEGELSTPLIAGNVYKIRFYVLLADFADFATNNFGVKFFKDSYNQRVVPISRGDVDANYTNVVIDTQNWHLVELEFTPQISDLQYFIIGNFFSSSETLTQVVSSSEWPYQSYYFIDDVSIENISSPIFEPLGPFCQGTTFTLPEQSQNGHVGKWFPEINNEQTTTYTFTPNNSDVFPVTLTVEITEPSIEPIFDFQLILCKGTIFTLPGVSENGIKGTWSPELNNQEKSTYMFTPEAGSCGLKTTITIEIVDQIKPEFTIPSFICEGSSLALSEVSDNGIRGIWTPAIDNQHTTTYTFIPVGHDCAVPVTATVEVKPVDIPLLNLYCSQNTLYVEVVNPDLTNQFQWQINGIAVDESSPTVQLSKHGNLLNEGQNIVTLSMTNTSGCVIVHTIEIENKNSCFIPRGISPQGDGVNDTFDISHFEGVSLKIFNRYGMKVYDKKNYRNEWYGQMNSSNTLLPSGTYFYHIVTNRGVVFTGWVQLVY